MDEMDEELWCGSFSFDVFPHVSQCSPHKIPKICLPSFWMEHWMRSRTLRQPSKKQRRSCHVQNGAQRSSRDNDLEVVANVKMLGAWCYCFSVCYLLHTIPTLLEWKIKTVDYMGLVVMTRDEPKTTLLRSFNANVATLHASQSYQPFCSAARPRNTLQLQFGCKHWCGEPIRS